MKGKAEDLTSRVSVFVLASCRTGCVAFLLTADLVEGADVRLAF